MAEGLYDLLFRAVKALPEEDQDRVLRLLLERRIAGMPAQGITAGRTPFVPPSGEPEWAALRLGERGAGTLRVVPVRLSQDQHDALKQWCESHEFSMAVVIRGLVDRFLASQQEA